MEESMFSDSDVFTQMESRFNLKHPETGTRDPSACIAAIFTLDNEIDAAIQFTRSLRTRRNALVPISLLPPEILVRVFHFLVLKEYPLSRKGGVGWIRVTHVCRYWRQVALDDSSLWAKIWGDPTNRNLKWISELLARAKNAPLDIEFNDVDMPSEKALLIIPQHLSRTRRLRFQVHDLSALHYGSVQDIFSQEAPALEHFELRVNWDTSYYFPAHAQDLQVGGNMLFKGHVPRLWTFSLFQPVIHWPLIPRGQLTQLKIKCPIEYVHPPGKLSIDQLVDLLVNCPALEILELESCLPSQLTEFPHDRTISLPHLSRLRLCGSTSRVMNTLTMLKLPSLTSLHLDCFLEIAHIDSELLLLRVISAHFRSPALVEFKSLTVSTIPGDDGALKIAASTVSSTSHNHQTQRFEGNIVGNPELFLSFEGLSGPGHSTDLFHQACKMLPISNLEFISMSTNDIIDINWFELFICCTSVTTMKAIGLGTSSLVRALAAPTVTNSGSSVERRKRKHDDRDSTLVQPDSTVTHTHPAIFPKLRFLELTKLNFSEGTSPAPGILSDVFKRGLQQRMAASGRRLKLLCISDCDIDAEYANDLQKLVEDFHWDGKETFAVFDPFGRTRAGQRNRHRNLLPLFGPE